MLVRLSVGAKQESSPTAPAGSSPMVMSMSSSPDMLKGFVRSLLGHSLSRAVLVSVADTCRLVNRNNHERFYKGKFEKLRYSDSILVIQKQKKQ